MNEVSAEIVEQCQNGDIAALGAIYRVYAERVYRLSTRLLGSEADAEDATQQIFLRVFRQIGKFDGRSSLATWTHRVATNHCLNLLRQRRPVLSLSECNGHTLPAATRTGGDPDTSDRLNALLAMLEPDDRTLIVLKEVEGLTYRELARVLDVPPGTVMSRLHRARGRLVAAVAALEAKKAKKANSGFGRRDDPACLSKERGAT